MSRKSHGRWVGLALVAAWVTACGASDEPPAPSNADAGPAPTSALGAMFVAQRGCPKCHQSGDPADGLLSGQTTPQPSTQAFPKNLTPDPDTGIDGWSDEQFLRALRDGLDDEGETLCPTMPRFSDMTDAEGKAIVAYLRSLPPVWRPVPESTCPPIKPKPEDDAGASD